jgi:hypothetical protein
MHLSRYADNCCASFNRIRLFLMNHWLDHQHLHFGEALLVGGVDGLFHGWRASAEAIGKLCTGGADRWQAAIRQIQAPVNFADILRARTST